MLYRFCIETNIRIDEFWIGGLYTLFVNVISTANGNLEPIRGDSLTFDASFVL